VLPEEEHVYLVITDLYFVLRDFFNHQFSMTRARVNFSSSSSLLIFFQFHIEHGPKKACQNSRHFTVHNSRNSFIRKNYSLDMTGELQHSHEQALQVQNMKKHAMKNTQIAMRIVTNIKRKYRVKMVL